MTENNRRSADRGEERNIAKDTLGALERKLREGDQYKPRTEGAGADSEAFKAQIESATQTFALKAKAAVEPQKAPSVILDLNKKNEIERFVGEGYELAMKSITDGNLIQPDEIMLPTLDEVIQILQSKLTKEQIETIKKMDVKTLIINPRKAFPAYVRNLDNGTRLDGQTDTYLWSNTAEQIALRDDELELGKKATGVKLGFVEGVEEIVGGRSGRLQSLIDAFEAKTPNGVYTPNAKVYALLMKQSILKGKPVDRINWSVLSVEDKKTMIRDDGFVSEGFWDSDGPGFDGNLPEGHYDYARFRPAVMDLNLNS